MCASPGKSVNHVPGLTCKPCTRFGPDHDHDHDHEHDVAVGTPVAGRPPHRSRRAELPHRAPASGVDGQSGHLGPPPVSVPAPASAQSGSASGAGVAGNDSPWPGPFPPRPPPARVSPRVRSTASSVLRARPTSHARSSPSCPIRVHGTDSRAVRPEPNMGSPSFRARCLHACTGSRTARDRTWTRQCVLVRVAFHVK